MITTHIDCFQINVLLTSFYRVSGGGLQNACYTADHSSTALEQPLLKCDIFQLRRLLQWKVGNASYDESPKDPIIFPQWQRKLLKTIIKLIVFSEEAFGPFRSRRYDMNS